MLVPENRSSCGSHHTLSFQRQEKDNYIPSHIGNAIYSCFPWDHLPRASDPCSRGWRTPCGIELRRNSKQSAEGKMPIKRRIKGISQEWTGKHVTQRIAFEHLPSLNQVSTLLPKVSPEWPFLLASSPLSCFNPEGATGSLGNEGRRAEDKVEEQRSQHSAFSASRGSQKQPEQIEEGPLGGTFNVEWPSAFLISTAWWTR